MAEQPAQPEKCQCPACKVTPHASDCAVHNAPAYQIGKCDCGAQPEQNNSRQLDWAKAQADHWKQHCFHLMKQLQEKNV